jgi:integrase
MKFTQATVNALQLGVGKMDQIIFCDDIPGFGVRLRAAGSKVYLFQYKRNGSTNRLTIGATSAVELAQARKIASQYHVAVLAGDDPAGDKREKIAESSNILGSLIEPFLARYNPGSVETKKAVERNLRNHAKPLHRHPVSGITVGDIDRLLDQIAKDTGPYAANRVRSALSGFYKWAVKKEHCASNPVVAADQRKEQKRDRVLSEAELKAVWQACGQLGQYGVIVRLLILTGQRRDEIGDLVWPEINCAAINLPAARCKNGRAHTVPLGPSATALIDTLRASRSNTSDRLFVQQYWSYYKKKLDELSGVTGWRVHDLRHTFATHLNEHGLAPPHIIEAVLNHAVPGIAGRYNHATYAEEKRAALAAWDARVRELVS